MGALSKYVRPKYIETKQEQDSSRTAEAGFDVSTKSIPMEVKTQTNKLFLGLSAISQQCSEHHQSDRSMIDHDHDLTHWCSLAIFDM